ncbi:hypothetical protein F5883DRAFT_620303 [Diaporthe sp. PMI_573]|nr:hypothetical protein F5883DRAFT_620303 [Diaporthaceae sp. PMI_573]
MVFFFPACPLCWVSLREAGVITSQPQRQRQRQRQRSAADRMNSYRLTSHRNASHRIATCRISRMDSLSCAPGRCLYHPRSPAGDRCWQTKTRQPTRSQTVSRHRSAEYHHILPTRLTASHRMFLLRPPDGPGRTMHLTTPQRPPASRSRPRRPSNGPWRTASRAACLVAGAPLLLLLPPLGLPLTSNL